MKTIEIERLTNQISLKNCSDLQSRITQLYGNLLMGTYLDFFTFTVLEPSFVAEDDI